jgi:HK97 family phage portal protein
MPRVAFKHPGRLSDQAAQRLKESLNTVLGSTDKSIVLEEGMSVERLTMDLASVQYEAVNQQLVEDIARFTGVPMPLMAEHSESSYATVRELMRRYADACVIHYAQAITRELTAKVCPSTRYLDLDLTYLQRGPLDTEMAGLSVGIQSSVLTPNEARRRFNLPPLPGGDDLVRRLDTGLLDDDSSDDGEDFSE